MIKGIDFFHPFEDDELNTLLRYSTVVKYEENEFVMQESVHSYNFYIILQGKAEVLKTKEDLTKKRVAILMPGACFGETALLLNASRTATVKALTPLFAFKIDGTIVEKIPFKLQAKLFKQFAITLAIRLQKASE